LLLVVVVKDLKVLLSLFLNAVVDKDKDELNSLDDKIRQAFAEGLEAPLRVAALQ
jgi:hypothetical protein